MQMSHGHEEGAGDVGMRRSAGEAAVDQRASSFGQSPWAAVLAHRNFWLKLTSQCYAIASNATTQTLVTAPAVRMSAMHPKAAHLDSP